MPCFSPMIVRYKDNVETGKKKIYWNLGDAREFYESDKIPVGLNAMQLPCSNCIGCRLERSRQWAVRCSHESQLYDDNSFVTLTFHPKYYAKMCPNGSLNRRHMQLFIKRLRKHFSDRKIRSFYCGEYGEKNGRAHYHAIFFNLEFPDKMFWKSVNGQKYYVSDILSKLWPYGHCVIGSVTFQSAAYVARYCVKKVNGKAAQAHYERVNAETGEIYSILPEFCQASLKPGIASDWFDKFGMSDIFPRDECVIEGYAAKPPRFYDKLLERKDPQMLLDVKRRREEKRLARVDDAVFSRLLVMKRLQEIRMNLLVRTLESGA